MADQLVGYWDSVNQQFQGPGNVPSGSVENLVATQVGNGATAACLPMGIATRAGRLVDVRVSPQTAITGNDTYVVDVKKNGVTVLTATITVDNTVTARASKAGSIAAASIPVAPGDFFEAAVTYTHNTGTAPANIVIQAQLIQN